MNTDKDSVGHTYQWTTSLNGFIHYTGSGKDKFRCIISYKDTSSEPSIERDLTVEGRQAEIAMHKKCENGDLVKIWINEADIGPSVVNIDRIPYTRKFGRVRGEKTREKGQWMYKSRCPDGQEFLVKEEVVHDTGYEPGLNPWMGIWTKETIEGESVVELDVMDPP